MALTQDVGEPVRILRVISRLNIGGPGQQAIWLSAAFQGGRFQTLLVTGRPGQTEGSLEDLAKQHHVPLVMIPELGRAIQPFKDLIALIKLIRLAWAFRPDIIHTHMAKAGTLGRLAGLLYNAFHWKCRLRLVHTFHGHVFHGYFGTLPSQFFMAIERWLARRTDCLIAVSDSVKAELLHYRIGRPEQLALIPVGLQLEPLLAIEPLDGDGAHTFRIGVVGRLVPIKNHRLFLDAVQHLSTLMPVGSLQCSIVGDGELRHELERDVARLGLHRVLEFQGWRFDLPHVYRSLDCVCLSSLNEGTPLSLIEAMAAARAVVATDVGGVRDLLGRPLPDQPRPGFLLLERGLLVRSGDARGLAEALHFLGQQPTLRQRLGEAGRAFIRSRFTAERLVRDVEHLYVTLLTPRESDA